MDTPPGNPVTQRVRAADVADLDREPGRAALAFSTDDGPEAVPVVVRRTGDGLMVGALPGAVPTPPPDRPVVVVDDGRWWFELRAIVRRGPLSRAPEGADGLEWFRLDPDREVAWDYGQLHREGT